MGQEARMGHNAAGAAQWVRQLKAEGVRFGVIDEGEAMRYLSGIESFHRLRSYSGAFERHSGGKHEGEFVRLEFATLVALASLDALLRRELLPLCLEVERHIKVRLLATLDAGKVGGPETVHAFMRSRPDDGAQLRRELERGMTSPYTHAMLESCGPDFPAWALVEVVPLGAFNEFWRFCATMLGDRRMQSLYYPLQSMRSLRNACCHDNCVLNDVAAGSHSHEVPYEVRRAVRAAGVSKGVAKSKLGNERLGHVATLLWLHSRSASRDSASRAAEGLGRFLGAVDDDVALYEGCTQYETAFAFLRALVGAWYPAADIRP